MAKSEYIGINNTARKVKGIYVGVNGVARKVTKGYIGVGGVARLFYAGYTWKRYNVSTTWSSSLYARYTDMSTGTFLLSIYNCNGTPLKITLFSSYSDTTNSTCTLSCNSSTGIFTCSNYKGSNVRYNSTIGSNIFDYEAEFPTNSYCAYAVILDCNDLDITSIGSPESSEDYNSYRRVSMYPGSHKYAFRKYFNGSNNYVEAYQSTKSEQIGSYIDTVSSSNPNAYPINGKHTDGYWYIKQ